MPGSPLWVGMRCRELSGVYLGIPRVKSKLFDPFGKVVVCDLERGRSNLRELLKLLYRDLPLLARVFSFGFSHL